MGFFRRQVEGYQCPPANSRSTRSSAGFESAPAGMLRETPLCVPLCRCATPPPHEQRGRAEQRHHRGRWLGHGFFKPGVGVYPELRVRRIVVEREELRILPEEIVNVLEG